MVPKSCGVRVPTEQFGTVLKTKGTSKGEVANSRHNRITPMIRAESEEFVDAEHMRCPDLSGGVHCSTAIGVIRCDMVRLRLPATRC